MDDQAIFWRIEHLPVYHDSRGDLSVIESVSERELEICGFTLWNSEKELIHKWRCTAGERLFVALSGHFSFEIVGPAGQNSFVDLETPDCGIWVASGTHCFVQSHGAKSILLQVTLGKIEKTL